MASSALPAGFRRLSAGRVVLVVDGEIEGAALHLDLLAADALERIFQAPEGATGRAPTALLPLPGGPGRVLVRRLQHGGVLGPLLGGTYLGMGRCLDELIATAQLRAAGAPVPRPALALGRRIAGPLFTCAVGTFFEEEAADGLAFLADAPDPMRLRRAARAAGLAVRRFHDAGGRHPDLHIKNLLLRERDRHTECIVIDLDRARVDAPADARERMAELMRLYRSLIKRDVLAAIGPRGCATFFAAYCGKDRELRGRLQSRLGPELRRLSIHQLGYR